MTSSVRLKTLARIDVSNVDKKTVEGQREVRLCNYTDVYYNDNITADMEFMPASATDDQLRSFSIRRGDVLITKDSETPEDIGIPAFVADEMDRVLCGYHLALVRPHAVRVCPKFLFWLLASDVSRRRLSAEANGITRFGLRAESFGNIPVPVVPLSQQRAIADYLDAETARIDGLIARKRRMIELLDERVDSLVMSWVGRSSLVGSGAVGAVPIRRALSKIERWAPEGEMVTAFRDGEVMTRSARGREGFTDAWTEGARFQVVRVGDVVVHGLDGFSGAIGDSQSDGVCSPVYHVCRPVSGGDPAYYGRLLRLLALSGYLGNFATSTRERAVDFRNWDLFGRIPVPDVPIADQLRIGDLIRAARPLRDKVRTSETLAMERRQALVTAVFTGELAVPEAVA